MLHRYEEALNCSHNAQQYDVSAIWANMGELATLGVQGRKEDARAALERALILQPDLSISFIEKALPITHAASRDHFIGGLVKAGVPD